MLALKTFLQADFGPTFKSWAFRLAAICAAVYVAGYTTGAFVHALNDLLSRKVAVMIFSVPATQPREAPGVFRVQRQAAVLEAPARVAAVAPPVEIPTRAERAKQLRSQDLTIKEIAAILETSATTVRRDLRRGEG